MIIIEYEGMSLNATYETAFKNGGKAVSRRFKLNGIVEMINNYVRKSKQGLERSSSYMRGID